MTGLLLRLAGPMQSWGEHSTFSRRDTCSHPTRSGLVGLIAAAQGRRRADPINDLSALAFTIRVDRPGTPMADFHTVGGGLPADRTVPTAEGKRRSTETSMIVSHRWYLADAVFTVAVTGPADTLAAIAAALARPAWAPYLGRRSCPAEPPVLLSYPVDDPVTALSTLPLARRRPRDQETVSVDFVLDTAPANAPTTRTTLNDIPVSFHPDDRRYLSRTVYLTTRRLPAQLCAGVGGAYLQNLCHHLNGARP